MVIKSSGSLSISEIIAEFGGTAPHSLGEYYRNTGVTLAQIASGTNVVVANIPQNANIPTSGRISMQNFYSGMKPFVFTISTSLQEVNLRNYLISQGWDGIAYAIVTLATGTYLWSDNTSVAGMTTGSFPGGLFFVNNGFIIGKGGAGGDSTNLAGRSGGPALSLSTNCTIINSGYIAGGGGGGGGFTREYVAGGGGGAGGGNGGLNSRYSIGGTGLGGAIGQSGAAGNGAANLQGSGGSAGGGGGGYDQQNFSRDEVGGGGGGGRIFPGVRTGTRPEGAGYGGGGQEVGGNNTGRGAAGGGGWGAAGGTSSGTGGAGGAAIIRNGFTATVQSGAERIWGSII